MSFDPYLLGQLKEICDFKPREFTKEQKAHMIASTVAAPCKMIDGKLVFSRSIAQANYNEVYDLLTKKEDHA